MSDTIFAGVCGGFVLAAQTAGDSAFLDLVTVTLPQLAVGGNRKFVLGRRCLWIILESIFAAPIIALSCDTFGHGDWGSWRIFSGCGGGALAS